MNGFQELLRASGKGVVQRIPALAGKTKGLPVDAEEVTQLLADEAFRDGVARIAHQTGKDEQAALAEAALYLR